MITSLFFDVDGTLIPFGQSLPENTEKALKEAKRRGARLFLATGRSPAELDRRLDAISFDGAIYSGGARAFVEGKDIYSAFVPDQDLDWIIRESEVHGWRLLFQCDDASYYTGDFHEILMDYFRRYVGGDLAIANMHSTASLSSIRNVTKILLLTPDGDMEEASSLLSSRFCVLNNTVGVPSSLMAEVCQKGVDKGRAMLAVLDFCTLAREDSMAFGDGSNDHELVEMAGIGVAMGNAEEPLKRIADYVTLDCASDGIGHALRHFGVI